MPGREKKRWEKTLHLSTMFERMEQYTKENDTDIGPLIKEDTMTGTERDTKEGKIQQDFLWALGPEAMHQITRSEYRTEPNRSELKSTN